ncbi:calcium-binding protein, partial [Xylella fastidiosa subsp. fastidiosa]
DSGRTRADIDTLRRLHGRNRGIKMRRESHHVMILLTP